MESYPQRKTTKLKGYDYSQNGYYFITLCTNDRIKYFGNVSRGGALLLPQMALSLKGKVAYEQWLELQNRYKTIIFDEFVVMPNHIHGIISITGRREEQSPSPTADEIVCAYKSVQRFSTNFLFNIYKLTLHIFYLSDQLLCVIITHS